MSKITQKNLIEQLETLKEIKPRKEWALLLKSQLLSKEISKPEFRVSKIGFWDFIRNSKFEIQNSRRLAYAFAVMLFLVVGAFGFARYTVPGDLLFPVKKIAEQSQAALTGQTGVQQNVATLNSRINDLVQVAKEGRKNNIPSAISEINLNASELVKSLKANPVSDPQTLKEIAASLKTLADVPGTDLTASPNVKDLYQTVVENQIADLEKSTLTDAQQTALEEIKELYSQGKYTDALEKILFLNI